MTPATEIKACCATAYSSAAVRWLIGESLHPGGLALTTRLARRLDVGAGDVVVDVASGPGTSAIEIARTGACTVIGVELAAANVELATARAAEAGLAGRVNFVQGDAEALPLRDSTVDGAICECSLCLFPDKDAAVQELARVLRPGARIALSDVTAVAESLPSELRTVSGWTACIADARPLVETASLFERAGFVVDELEQRDELLAELIERVDGRLRFASFLQEGIPDRFREGLTGALDLVSTARAAVDAGVLGYGILEATRA